MAGHSHWAKIKRAKGSNDAQRAVLFAKISSEIIAAARAAGGDLANIRLQAAITKAKVRHKLSITTYFVVSSGLTRTLHVRFVNAVKQHAEVEYR